MKIKATKELLQILISGFYFFLRERCIYTVPLRIKTDEKLRPGECWVMPRLNLWGKQTRQRIKVQESEVEIRNTNCTPLSTYKHDGKEAFEKTLDALVEKVLDLPEWVFLTQNFKGRLRLQCFKVEFWPNDSEQAVLLGEIEDGYHEIQNLNEEWMQSPGLVPRECPETPPLYNEILYGLKVD